MTLKHCVREAGVRAAADTLGCFFRGCYVRIAAVSDNWAWHMCENDRFAACDVQSNIEVEAIGTTSFSSRLNAATKPALHFLHVKYFVYAITLPAKGKEEPHSTSLLPSSCLLC